MKYRPAEVEPFKNLFELGNLLKNLFRSRYFLASARRKSHIVMVLVYRMKYE